MSNQYPELRLMYAIPNAGGYTGGFKKNLQRVLAMRRQGVKKGVPDVCLPVARRTWHALYIEMKREGDEEPRPDQVNWHDALREQGNCVAVAHGLQDAIDLILRYLR